MPCCPASGHHVQWLDRTRPLAWQAQLKEAPAWKPSSEVLSYCQSANQKIEYPSASLNLTISIYPSVKARWKFPIIRNIWKHLETAKCKDMLCCLCRGRGWTAFGSCRSWLIGICPRVQFHEHTHCACHMMSHDRKKWKTYHHTHTVWTQAQTHHQTHHFRCILGALLVGYPLKSIIDKQNMCDSRALGSTLDWSKYKAFNQSTQSHVIDCLSHQTESITRKLEAETRDLAVHRSIWRRVGSQLKSRSSARRVPTWWHFTNIDKWHVPHDAGGWSRGLGHAVCTWQLELGSFECKYETLLRDVLQKDES